MKWLREFFRAMFNAHSAPPDPGPAPEFEPCDCLACQLGILIAYVELSREVLEDYIRLQGAIDGTPVERMQDMPERVQ